jgi:hypothetical protein
MSQRHLSGVLSVVKTHAVDYDSRWRILCGGVPAVVPEFTQTVHLLSCEK